MEALNQSENNSTEDEEVIVKQMLEHPLVLQKVLR